MELTASSLMACWGGLAPTPNRSKTSATGQSLRDLTPNGPLQKITLWRREVSLERTSSAWVGTHKGDQSGSDRRQARLRRRTGRLFSPAWRPEAAGVGDRG